jgi:hypothetical protein
VKAGRKLVSCSAYFFTLKVEAICSSETSVDTHRTTRRYIPEDGNLQDNHVVIFSVTAEIVRTVEMCLYIEKPVSNTSINMNVHAVSVFCGCTLMIYQISKTIHCFRSNSEYEDPDGLIRHNYSRRFIIIPNAARGYGA